MSNWSYHSTTGIQAEDNYSNKILVYGISEMLDMELTSVKYEAPNTTITQNANFILSKFIQDTMVLIHRTSAQVYAGCQYPMTMNALGSVKKKTVRQNLLPRKVLEISYKRMIVLQQISYCDQGSRDER